VEIGEIKRSREEIYQTIAAVLEPAIKKLKTVELKWDQLFPSIDQELLESLGNAKRAANLEEVYSTSIVQERAAKRRRGLLRILRGRQRKRAEARRKEEARGKPKERGDAKRREDSECRGDERRKKGAEVKHSEETMRA